MSIIALNGRLMVHGGAWLLAALAALPCCGKSNVPPPLPVDKAPSTAAPREEKVIEYRQKAGVPIAPTVVSDDPPPRPVQGLTGVQVQRPATLNGDPNGISRETLNRAVQAAMGSFAGCFSSLTQDPPVVAVSFEAEPSGRPSLVRVSGAPPDAESCIRNIVLGVRFPSFEGKPVQVDLPLSFHRVPGVAQSAGNSVQQAPKAPPLFMDP
jgi:hypothetical protein